MGPDNFYPSTSDNAGLRRQKVCYEHSRSAGVCNNSCHSLDTKITEPRVQTRLCLAEKQGFEPWLRFTRTTPLAGEPLRPLGYFSIGLPDYTNTSRERCQLF